MKKKREMLWLLDYPFCQLFSDNMDVLMFVANLSRITQLQSVIFCLRAEIQGSTVSISFWVLFSDPTSTFSWAVSCLWWEGWLLYVSSSRLWWNESSCCYSSREAVHQLGMQRAEPLELVGQVVENGWTPAQNKTCSRAASRQTVFPFPAAWLKNLHFTDSRGNVFNS